MKRRVIITFNDGYPPASYDSDLYDDNDLNDADLINNALIETGAARPGKQGIVESIRLEKMD